MKFTYLVTVGLIGIGAWAYAQEAQDSVCQGNVVERFLCQKMINLRSQIFNLETQSELMQVNPEYMGAIGRGLQQTAKEALQLIGPGLPEHRQGLTGIVLMGEQLAVYAAKGDGQMMNIANSMRTNCAACHAENNPPGNIGWDDIFRNDWSQISAHCRQSNKNPYLCKSMHALLATQTYNGTAWDGHVENFEMTRNSATEIVRILNDLHAKGFNHLPEEKRLQAVSAATEVIEFANRKDRRAFEKAKDIMVTCKSCHNGLSTGEGNPWRPNNFSVN